MALNIDLANDINLIELLHGHLGIKFNLFLRCVDGLDFGAPVLSVIP